LGATGSSTICLPHFYTGRVVRIDLSALEARVEPLNKEWAERYIGGKGLLLRYLWEEVPANVDPWAPENPVILMTGPIAGTGICTGSRLVVGCKSPVTGVYTDSYVGGSFAPELKFAGYDAVIVEGQAPYPVVVTVRDSAVEFLPARPKYWGMKTSEIEAALRSDFDKNAKVLSIGPAGEAEIPWACVSCDQFHKAGRGGHGALLGRKNLKAVAVRGTGAVHVGDTMEFLGYLRDLQAEFMEDNLWLTEEGTLVLVDPINDGGAMPTRNWSQGQFAEAHHVNSEAFRRVRTGRRACTQCSMACRQWHVAGDVRGEGPEYETVALCGPNCGVGDIPALMKFNAECDEWGLDTISSGGVVGLAMDLTEKGIKDFGIRFGDAAYAEMPALIARREGVGADLALGARALGAKYGHPELAMEVKNMELPGYDPRGSFGMSLSYATSDRGGCHMRAYTVGGEVLSGALPPDTLEGKAALVLHKENWTSLYYSGIWCGNFGFSAQQVGEQMRRVWGRPFAEEDLLHIGERIWNLGRLFNVREGAEADTAPSGLLGADKAFRDGPSAESWIDQEAFTAALQEFYKLRGWDEQGVPTEAKLAELGVDVRL
jgi:aldehyde:ferredoxin oxidoreductase